MNNSEIVSKLWNLCNVLRDDGITYHQYVTELVHETHRLALMNAMLHDINGKIQLGDTLSNMGKSMKG